MTNRREADATTLYSRGLFPLEDSVYGSRHPHFEHFRVFVSDDDDPLTDCFAVDLATGKAYHALRFLGFPAFIDGQPAICHDHQAVALVLNRNAPYDAVIFFDELRDHYSKSPVAIVTRSDFEKSRSS